MEEQNNNDTLTENSSCDLSMSLLTLRMIMQGKVRSQLCCGYMFEDLDTFDGVYIGSVSYVIMIPLCQASLIISCEHTHSHTLYRYTDVYTV